MLQCFGGPAGFELVEQPMPLPGPGEVRVRVLAASVQFTDTILRRGKYPDLKQKPPLVLGYDVVGEIDRVGSAACGYGLGERVAALTMVGSYARYRLLRSDDIVRVTPGVDSAEACALVLSWATAYQLLHRVAEVKKGQRVLIQGATGAVGQALITLGKLAGLRVWATAHGAHSELVRALGATQIDVAVNPPGIEMPSEFDVVFDGIGEHGFARSWASVKPGGVLAAFGFSSVVQAGGGLLEMGWRILRLHLWNGLPNGKAARFYSITALRKRHPEWYRADLGKLFELLAEGAIHPRIAQRIGLDAVGEAHRRLDAGGLEGKIMICP